MQWGENQLQIIRHREGNLIVSAAAGAGKTSVLVERIVQMILDSEHAYRLDQMLIVTFTKAAAGQMKERIFRRIQELLNTEDGVGAEQRAYLQEQLALLPGCAIMTIDAFCLQVLRKYIAQLPQLDPGFRTGESNEMELLAGDVLEEVLEDFYEREDEGRERDEFDAMVEQFAGRSEDKDLEPVLRQIYTFMQSMPEPWEWLDKSVENYKGQPLYPALRGVRNVLQVFHQAFLQEKMSRSIVEFSDMEHFAKQILWKDGAPTQAAQELSEQYDAIFIDEYQDSNMLQEVILNSIARRDEEGNAQNIFMVGDVKQSIYSFRFAQPELFLQKLEDYHLDRNPRKIFLQKNYRSRAEILTGVNEIFEYLMRKECGGVEYSGEQALVPGGATPEPDPGMEDFYPKIYSLSVGANPNQQSKHELEALWVAEQIETMLREGKRYGVRDEKQGGYRPLRPGDIVILLRSAKEMGSFYQKALEDRHIPASAKQSDRFFDTPEICLALNLLRVIDNAQQDIPLEGVLHSPLFGFTSEELAQIRVESDRSLPFHEILARYAQEGEDLFLASRLQEFYGKLEQWRQWSECLTVRELLSRLYRTTGLYEYVGSMQDGERRRINLDLLLSRSEEFEQGIYSGVFQFLRFIDRMKAREQDYEEASRGYGGNVVQIMTIHGSKGLEFPVVFLCDTGREFQLKDQRQHVLLHLEEGIGSYWLDPEKMLYFNTEIRQNILERKKQENYAEEMRVLYVAMTRAKDRLIVTGTGKESWEEGTGEDTRLTVEEILKARSVMGWLYPILTRRKGHHWHLETAVIGEGVAESEEAAPEEVSEKPPQYTEEELNRKLLWRYPYAWRNELPVLLSVSQLKKEAVIEEAEQEFSWDELLQPAEEEREDTPVRGARGGTAFHEVVARADLSELATDAGRKEVLHRLAVQGILTEAEEKAFPMSWLQQFGASALCRRMRSSSSLLREESFLCGFTPQELHSLVPHFQVPEEADEDELIIVQGVIDAAFLEDGQWILVDYKTDRYFSAETLAMYQTQLAIYGQALGRITRRPVKEKILYQVRSGKEYKM